MTEVVSTLPTFALAISGALNNGLDRHLTNLQMFESWMKDARFVCTTTDTLVRVEESSKGIRFLLAKQWFRKPTRMPTLVVETRLALSKGVQTELVIQRSVENYVIISEFHEEASDSYKFVADVRLDARHDDAFALAFRRAGIRNGYSVIEHERLTSFSKTMLDLL